MSENRTGLTDRHGVEICTGDFVSLAGNITADDSLGDMPNGWMFEEDDIYQVYFDERIQKYSLRLDVEPDSRYNVKYMNHAVSLLYGQATEIVKEQEPK
jgi:hypothetical protein